MTGSTKIRTLEKLRMVSSRMSDAVSAHGMPYPDGIFQRQRLANPNQIISKLPPGKGLCIRRAAMTAHVDGVDMPVLRQLGNDLIPAAGMKPCSMDQQHLLPARLAPFKYTEIDIGKTNQMFFGRLRH